MQSFDFLNNSIKNIYDKNKKDYVALKYVIYESMTMLRGGKLQNVKYRVHDNGGRPLEVEILKDIVNIYKQVGYKDGDHIYADKPTLTFGTKKVFIGKSPRNKWTEFSGGYGDEFDGNSILIYTKDNEYIFIGVSVFSFEAKGKIVDFVSMVGNSDVSYPYAVDEFENIYLLLDDIVLLHNDEIKICIKNYDNNPYEYYYDPHLITDDRCNISATKIMNNKLNIREFMIGDKPRIFAYVTNPEKVYDDHTEDNTRMYVIYNDGKKELLTKKKFVTIMKKIQKQLFFEKLIINKRYLERDIGGSLLDFYMDAITITKVKQDNTDKN